MINASLVAFYGDKPSLLKNLILELQTCLVGCELINNNFIPYQLEQVHGTIIGCEGIKTALGIENRWFKERRQETKYINLEGLVDYLQKQVYLPLNIGFGGYKRHNQYNFLSRNQHLYYRSFQIQAIEKQGVPLLIGWSWDNNQVSLAIDNLRRSLQQFNLLHKYHINPNDIDNDFYLRLGTINRQLNSQEIQEISNNICNLLENKNPIYLSLDKENIAFAQYQDLTLPPATTRAIPISEINFSDLKQIYVTDS